MNNINKIIRMASVGAALAVVFTIAFASPASAQASYGSYGGGNRIYSTQSYYISGHSNNYSYSYSRPIVVSEPPQVIYQPSQPIVISQPPQVVYQQPQPVVYQQPVYQQPAYYPLTVTCYANPSTASVGQTVTWDAYVSNGSNSYSSYNPYNNGSYDSNSYSYTWTGTDSSYQSGQTASSVYYTPGSYTASVTVYVNGQSITQSCGYVTVSGSYAYNYPSYTTVAPNTGGNLVAACFANRTTASVGTPVTWAVETTGGTGQYAYQWSGTDGLSGTGASITQSYDRTGQKNATVLISSGGQTISQACGDAVAVRAYASAKATNYQGAATVSTPASSANPSSLSAAAMLGLGNIPWGWMAILVIIVLGVVVFYLLFNRHKV